MDAELTDDDTRPAGLEHSPDDLADESGDGIALVPHDQHATVVVHGELDMRNAARLWEQARAAYAVPDLRALLIDLTYALFLESMTIAVLLEIAKDATRRHVQLGIVVGRGSVARRVLTLARVDGLLNLFDTETDALETLLGRAAT